MRRSGHVMGRMPSLRSGRVTIAWPERQASSLEDYGGSTEAEGHPGKALRSLAPSVLKQDL